jgi:hypothetical protein
VLHLFLPTETTLQKLFTKLLVFHKKRIATKIFYPQSSLILQHNITTQYYNRILQHTKKKKEKKEKKKKIKNVIRTRKGKKKRKEKKKKDSSKKERIYVNIKIFCPRVYFNRKDFFLKEKRIFNLIEKKE